MPKGPAKANAVLNLLFGGTALAADANVVFAAFVGDPQTTGTEPVGGAYARVTHANNKTTWGAAASKSLKNAIAVQFPTATASWGTISHLAIYNSDATPVLIASGALTTATAIAANDRLVFDIGAITINET